MSQPATSGYAQVVLEDIHYEAYGVDKSYIDRIDSLYLFEMVQLETRLDGAAIDTLHALYTRGPLDDGDVPSKRGRDFLVEYQLAARIRVKGEDGYNACTHYGSQLYRFHKNLRELKEKQVPTTPDVPHHPV